MDIYHYVRKQEDIIKEVNTIDAMIMSRMAYLHLEVIKKRLPLTILELTNYLTEMKTNLHDEKLIYALKESVRYQDIEIINLQSVLDMEKEEQFMAVTFKLPESLFIAFRGTNKNIIGYKEDLNMSFMTIPSQVDALSYVNNERNAKAIYLGGHSKGGNLAMYAGVHAKLTKRRLIKKIFNFDGPGFLTLDKAFQRNKKKIINYFPAHSFVGTLMYNDSNTIFFKTTRMGIELHNMYYWSIIEDDLEIDTQVLNSQIFHDNCLLVLKTIDIERRREIIDYFYQLMVNKKIKSIQTLKLDEIEKIINRVPKISKEERKVLLAFIKSFLKCLMP